MSCINPASSQAHTLFLSVSSTLSRHDGRRSSSSALVGESGFGLLGEVGEVVVVVVAVVVVAVVVEDDSFDSGLDDCQGKQEKLLFLFCCLKFPFH